MKSIDDNARKQREIEHHRKISQKAGETWGWETPAGKLRVERRIALFQKLGELNSTSKVLELGCGTGIFSEKLSTTGIQLSSIDLSPDLLEQAKDRIKNKNVQFYLQDAENLEFSDNTFDTVLGTSILHHLRIERALSEIYRVLKPKGLMVFSEPNMINPQVFMERHVPSIRESSGTSLDETAFIRWKLKKWILQAGFEDVNITPFDFLHPKTPPSAIPMIRSIGAVVEKTPLLREISGSLIISGRKQ